MKNVRNRSSALDHRDTPHRQAEPSTNQIRWYLVRAVIFLMFFTLAVYIFVRDIALVGTGTIVMVAVLAVFRYYFPWKSK